MGMIKMEEIMKIPKSEMNTSKVALGCGAA